MPGKTATPSTPKNANTVLTFNNGKFVLRYPLLSLQEKVLKKNAHWASMSGRQPTYETTNLKEAVVFEVHADDKAKRVFHYALQRRYTLPKLPPLSFLDPHQREGIKWVLTRSRSYLAHAPGAGKTAQAIVASCLVKESGQILFIVPPGLAYNWECEIWKVTEWLGVAWPTIGRVTDSAKADDVAWRAEFVIVPDSMLTKGWVYDRLLKMQKKFIAVDEASRFKEPFALRSIAFYGGQSGDTHYRGLFQKCPYTVFLDGSPMPNRPMELWAPTYALHPLAIDAMTQDNFGYRYCGPRINAFGQYTFDHSSHELELQEKLQKDFMHVVGEEQLMHPERRRSMLFIDRVTQPTPHQDPIIEEWERRHLGEVSEDLSQGEVAKLRRELGIQKIKWIASYVKRRLEDKNESILLFAWHREVCEGLAERLTKFSPGLVMGGVKNSDREEVFKKFQSGEKRLIIGNILAMGRGHNLQKADRVIFGEFSWTDELNKQCEKRASRRGSEKKFVRCEYIVVPKSIDEYVLRSIFTKEKRVKQVIG